MRKLKRKGNLKNEEPEDCLLPPGHAGLLLVGGWGDALQLEAGHWALGHSWALLQILKIRRLRLCNFNHLGSKTKLYLENQLATRGPHHLPLIALGIVRQPPAIGDTLDHLGPTEV